MSMNRTASRPAWPDHTGAGGIRNCQQSIGRLDYKAKPTVLPGGAPALGWPF